MMKKSAITFLFLFVLQISFSQNNKVWKGYFSYNDIKDISQSPDMLFAATENALFSDNITSGVVKTTNTIDGLSGKTISALYYSPTFKKTLIGYENGLIIVKNEIDGSVLNVIDIISKSLPPNIKKVNHFNEYNGIVYASCDFGIVQYNLATLQFGDTYFIGDNGAQIVISQTTIFNGKIYASTPNNGIRSADITNPNLNDFSQWTTVANFGWSGIEAFGTELIAVTTSGNLMRLQGTTFVNIANLPQPAIDIRANGIYLIVTTSNHVFIYNTSLGQIADINSNQLPDAASQFTCATVIDDTVFMGTLGNGIISKKINASTFETILPDGPLKNAIFSINTSSNSIWAVYGGYDVSYNPYSYDLASLNHYGISKYKNNKWLNISYAEIENMIHKEAAALVRITLNPNNESQVYISSFHSGLLKFENEQITNLYDSHNTGTTGLEALAGYVPDEVRINGSAFDKAGNLWMTNSLVKKALKVLKSNGQWQSYDMQSVYQSLGIFNLGRLSIDKNGTKWMTTQNDGIIGFNENYNNLLKTIKMGNETGNLPINDARVAAIDNRNQMWIGTRSGLRILSSVDSFLTPDQLTTEPIIIVEENLAQELLFQQFITDIVVDGANNKWIGTTDAGVFLVSPNGQQTIHHFTADNSPLPSNTINDIDINGATGEVFFATNKGMVSFKGTATSANEDLNNVFVFPNPVRPNYTGTVKISGLIDKANVKITDIEGNLVYEAVSEGGTIEWDTTAFGKYRVASGVYMIFIAGQDGQQTKVKKVMIIR